MHGSQTGVRRSESALDPHECVGLMLWELSVVLRHLKDPLELVVKRREFLPGYGVLSRCNITLAVESDVKTHSFQVALASRAQH